MGALASTAPTPAMLRLLATHFCLRLAAAQMVRPGLLDKNALLEVAAAADTSRCHGGTHYGRSNPCPLDSWDAATEPCGEGWDDRSRGWVGVVCDDDGRVAELWLNGVGVGGDLLPVIGRLGALLVLSVCCNPMLSGDVAELAGLTELRHLALGSGDEPSPLVRGDVRALAALVNLGGVLQDSDGNAYTGRLSLAGTGVHGPVAALRAVAGLGGDWGPDCASCSRAADTFTPCSAFGGCGAAELALVPNATDAAGNGACTCCVDSAGRSGSSALDNCSATCAAQPGGGDGCSVYGAPIRACMENASMGHCLLEAVPPARTSAADRPCAEPPHSVALLRR